MCSVLHKATSLRIDSHESVSKFFDIDSIGISLWFSGNDSLWEFSGLAPLGNSAGHFPRVLENFSSWLFFFTPDHRMRRSGIIRFRSTWWISFNLKGNFWEFKWSQGLTVYQKSVNLQITWRRKLALFR